MSGLVPIGLLVLAAVGYPRLRPGARATHTGGLAARPAEYEQRVIGFFDRALLGSS